MDLLAIRLFYLNTNDIQWLNGITTVAKFFRVIWKHFFSHQDWKKKPKLNFQCKIFDSISQDFQLISIKSKRLSVWNQLIMAVIVKYCSLWSKWHKNCSIPIVKSIFSTILLHSWATNRCFAYDFACCITIDVEYNDVVIM